jgi:hypothetical protein
VIANKFILLITAIGLTFGTSRLHAQGDIEAVNLGVYTGGVFSPYVMGPLDDGTLGWTFSPSQNIVIDSLGWMFGGTNSPSIPVVSVGLWSVDGTLLRSTVIDNNSVSINGNLYESIDPLFVSAGSTLVIGAASVSGSARRKSEVQAERRLERSRNATTAAVPLTEANATAFSISVRDERA